MPYPGEAGTDDIAEAVLAERERCAKIADAQVKACEADQSGRLDGACCVSSAEHIAAEIRCGA